MRFLATIVLGISLMLSIGDLHAQSDVIQVEYFFDTDPGMGAGTSLAISSGATISLDNQTINTSGLDHGFHTLHLRARNSNFIWGPYESKVVFVDRSIGFNDLVEIAEMEYFIDADPGFGSGTDIAVTGTPTSFSTTSTIDTDGLTQGFHTLFIRGKSTSGTWGAYESKVIFIEGAAGLNDLVEISELEYFIDTDPGTWCG